MEESLTNLMWENLVYIQYPTLEMWRTSYSTICKYWPLFSYSIFDE